MVGVKAYYSAGWNKGRRERKKERGMVNVGLYSVLINPLFHAAETFCDNDLSPLIATSVGW